MLIVKSEIRGGVVVEPKMRNGEKCSEESRKILHYTLKYREEILENLKRSVDKIKCLKPFRDEIRKRFVKVPEDSRTEILFCILKIMTCPVWQKEIDSYSTICIESCLTHLAHDLIDELEEIERSEKDN